MLWFSNAGTIESKNVSFPRQFRFLFYSKQSSNTNLSPQSKSSQSLVTELQEIDKLKNQINEVHVPIEVFDYIDSGRNPQLYTKDCIEKALTKNEEVKQKIDAYRKFKANLLVELQKTFPTELNKYRAIRGDEWSMAGSS